jgi:hypothetical protein
MLVCVLVPLNSVPTEIEELMNEHGGVGTLDFTLLALHVPQYK